MDEWSIITEDTFRKLCLNSPIGGWFLVLQDIHWGITESNLLHTDVFFPPHLTRITIYMPRSWRNSKLSRDILVAFTSTITALPASTLQSLSIHVERGAPSVGLEDTLSSVALQCGPSLTEFASPIPLSDAAVIHLIQLPHLHTLRIENPPPNYSASSLPLAFPPLTKLTLGENVVHKWLPLFERPEDGGSIVQNAPPLSRVKASLKSLKVEGSSGLVIDVFFTSPFRTLRNLVDLCVEVGCPYEADKCAFKLDDDSITKLVMALPQLQGLYLGSPCRKNTCTTTVASLIPISVHCVKLRQLGIHFNTTNIIEDLVNISKDPRFQHIRSLPRCTLSRLFVGEIPLTLDGPGFETVVDGMIDIFPSLERCVAIGPDWNEISERMAKRREV